MVTKRFLAVFYPAAEFLETTRITRVEGEPFKSVGKVLVNPGWLAVYGKEAQDEDTPTLAPVKPGETGADTRESRSSRARPSRRRATRKPRCSAPWKAPASWWRTRNCARP